MSVHLRGLGKVLIDTWWNVNTLSPEEHRKHCRVLIDTWWNVNDVNDGDKLSADSCFNRYMVECECRMHLLQPFPPVRFNRYMVECELALIVFVIVGVLSFNRYMVECELFF